MTTKKPATTPRRIAAKRTLAAKAGVVLPKDAKKAGAAKSIAEKRKTAAASARVVMPAATKPKHFTVEAIRNAVILAIANR